MLLFTTQTVRRWLAQGKLKATRIMSWFGKIVEKLGGSKTISNGKIIINRDINGARNILLRALSVASTDIRCVSCG